MTVISHKILQLADDLVHRRLHPGTLAIAAPRSLNSFTATRPVTSPEISITMAQRLPYLPHISRGSPAAWGVDDSNFDRARNS